MLKMTFFVSQKINQTKFDKEKIILIENNFLITFNWVKFVFI